MVNIQLPYLLRPLFAVLLFNILISTSVSLWHTIILLSNSLNRSSTSSLITPPGYYYLYHLSLSLSREARGSFRWDSRLYLAHPPPPPRTHQNVGARETERERGVGAYRHVGGLYEHEIVSICVRLVYSSGRKRRVCVDTTLRTTHHCHLRQRGILAH